MAKRKKQNAFKTGNGQPNGSNGSADEDKGTYPLRGAPFGRGKPKDGKGWGGGKPYPDWREKTNIEPPDRWQ